MPRYTNIHFVDDLNQGSLIAEAEANSLLVDSPMRTSSSGTLVKLPKRITFGRTNKLINSYLNSAVKQGTINRKYIDSIREQRDLTVLKEFLESQQFLGQRTLVKLLDNPELNLEGGKRLLDYINLKTIKSPLQTSAVYGGSNLVVAMSNSAYERVKQINSGTGKPPIIVEMKYFAGLTYNIPDISLIKADERDEKALEAGQKIVRATKLVLERALV